METEQGVALESALYGAVLIEWEGGDGVITRIIDGEPVVIFRAGPYRPGLGAKTPEAWADDILVFAIAYADGTMDYDPDDWPAGEEGRAWLLRWADEISADIG